MIQILPERPAGHQKPDLVLEFTKGDYNHSLQCYERAKHWVVETGQAFREDMCGIINRPSHPQSSSDDRIAPFHLLADKNWTVRVEFFTTTEEVFDWLKSLNLPEDSEFLNV